eukprot:COSAG01_NODE_1185_length_11350_cov_57.861781_12_plen_125_part_00
MAGMQCTHAPHTRARDTSKAGAGQIGLENAQTAWVADRAPVAARTRRGQITPLGTTAHTAGVRSTAYVHEHADRRPRTGTAMSGGSSWRGLRGDGMPGAVAALSLDPPASTLLFTPESGRPART